MGVQEEERGRSRVGQGQDTGAGLLRSQHGSCAILKFLPRWHARASGIEMSGDPLRPIRDIATKHALKLRCSSIFSPRPNASTRTEAMANP